MTADSDKSLHPIPQSRSAIWWCRLSIKHYRKLFVLIFSVVVALSAVAVLQFGFLIKQTEPTDYDWDVATTIQSQNQDALTYAEKSISSSTVAAIDVKIEERTLTKGNMLFLYWPEKLTSTESILTGKNLQTMCEAENVILGDVDYPKFCYRGNSGAGNTTDTKDGETRRCAKQLLSIVSLYYLSWSRSASGSSYWPSDPLYATVFGAFSANTLAFLQMYSGVPVMDGIPPDAPSSNDELWDSENPHKRKCPLLPDSYVQNRTASLINLIGKANAARSTLGFFFSYDVEDKQRSYITRSSLTISGWPLPSFNNKLDRPEAQEKLLDVWYNRMELVYWGYFSMVNTNTQSAYRPAKPVSAIVNGTMRVYSSAASRNGLDIKYAAPWLGNEFSRVVNNDLLWVLGSIMFVFLYIFFHTGSMWLASLGMFNIFMCLPVGYFLYRAIGQIDFYQQLHILCIFLVMGIGADDVFVFVDAWKMAKAEPNLDTVFKQLLVAWVHTAQSTFNTTLTTVFAFISTSITGVMPISAFSIFANMSIISVFLLTIGFYPLVMLIYEYDILPRWNRLFRKPAVEQLPWGIEADLPNHDAKVDDIALAESKARVGKGEGSPGEVSPRTREEREAELNADQARTDVQLRFAQKLFRHYYAPALAYAPFKAKGHGWFKPVALGLLAVFFALGFTGAIFASKLQGPTKQEEWFPKDHMLSGFGDINNDLFLAGAESQYTDMKIVLGIQRIERPNFSMWAPGKNRGAAVWDTNFDLSSAAAQDSLLQVCAKMREVKCSLVACVGGYNRIVRPDKLECFLEEFDEWYTGKFNVTGRPTGADFNKYLQEYADAGKANSANVGFVNGTLRFVTIPFSSTMLQAQPYTKMIQYWNLSHSQLHAIAKAEDSAGHLGNRSFITAGASFTFPLTERALVDNVIQNMQLVFPACWVVLLFATGSPRIATLAIVTIGFVVATTLGFAQGVMGWALGVAETVASCIILGFSVDYIVHLGHSYGESQHFSRSGKASDALTTMGMTVIAGAITTFGSGVFMFGCQLTFFTKMAVLVTVVIASAIVYSLCVFMPLCEVFGPEGDYKFKLSSLDPFLARLPKFTGRSRHAAAQSRAA